MYVIYYSSPSLIRSLLPNATPFIMPDFRFTVRLNKKNVCVYGQPPILTFFISNYSTLIFVSDPTLSIFTKNSDNHFCCLISSNVLFIQPLAFLSKLRAKKVEKQSTNDGLPEISKVKYRIPGTTISGFADSKEKKKNIDRPTLDFFFDM